MIQDTQLWTPRRCLCIGFQLLCESGFKLVLNMFLQSCFSEALGRPLDIQPHSSVGLGLVVHISFGGHQELAGLLAFLVLALATFVLYLQSEQCLRAMSWDQKKNSRGAARLPWLSGQSSGQYTHRGNILIRAMTKSQRDFQIFKKYVPQRKTQYFRGAGEPASIHLKRHYRKKLSPKVVF